MILDSAPIYTTIFLNSIHRPPVLQEEFYLAEEVVLLSQISLYSENL